MVESIPRLDSVFGSLADATRRDIIRRVSFRPLSVNQIAEPYDISVAAVSKHLIVLEKAGLIVKHREGKQQVVRVAPNGLKGADDFLQRYRKLWEGRLDALERYLKEEKK